MNSGSIYESFSMRATGLAVAIFDTPRRPS